MHLSALVACSVVLTSPMVAALRMNLVKEPCAQYSLPVDSMPSGNGKLWEYYHFMVDFAPALYYHIRNEPAGCKTLYAPGWHDDHKFALTLPRFPARSMQEKFDYFFGKPFGLTMELVDDREVMEKGIAEKHLIDWDSHSEDREWANQPAEYFTEFRQFARTLPGLTPVKRDVLAVERKNLEHYRGPRTGAVRRSLADVFYDRLLEDSKNHGLDTSVVSLETKSAADQIALFSDVKVIIGQHGAGLSNMLYADPETLIIEIGYRLQPCYENLARKLGLHYLHHESTDYSEDIINAAVSHEEKTSQLIQYVIPRFLGSKAETVDCHGFSVCFGRRFKQSQTTK